MTRSARWLTLSVLIILLLSPLAGVSTFTSVQQELLPSAFRDSGRGSGDDYSVELYAGERQEGDEELTRNQTRSYDFLVVNSGSQNDTYNLTVDWDDPESYGWHGSLSVVSIYIPAGQDRTFDLVVTSPRGDVVRDNSTMFNLTATSTNSTSVSASDLHMVRIITPYAVDVYEMHPALVFAKRGEKASFGGEIKNVGDNTDSYALRIDFVPKDWIAELSTTDIDSLVSGDNAQFQVEVTVPDTAGQDEYALVRVTVTSKTTEYSHIDGESWANTTASDGRIYGVDLQPDSGSRQAIPGGLAEYVFTVTNSGNETDTILLEVDIGETQGWTVMLDRDRIEDLGPGIETTVTFQVNAPQDATAEDWCVAGVEARSENREQHRIQVNVNTTIRIPVRGVDLAIDSETKAGEPGEQLTYTLTLTNSGSDPDSYDLTVQKPPTWQIQLSASKVDDLSEGDSATLELQVTIPYNSPDTDTALSIVTAISRGNNSVSNTTEALTAVVTVYGLTMIVDRSAQALNPGNSTSFTYTLYNYGNGHENLTFAASWLPAVDWTVTGLPDRVELTPFNGIAEVTVTIAVPSSQSPYTADLKLVASVEDNPAEQVERSVTLTVEYYAALQLQLEQTTATGPPGSSHTFSFTLTNQGNLQDMISLSTAGLPNSWQVQFADSNHPQVGLVLVTLAPGAPMELQLTTTSSSQEIASTFQFLLVATSGNNPQVSVDELMAVMVDSSHGLELEASETTKQSLPGQPVTFSFIVRNSGNAQAGVQLTASGVPADWNGSFSVQSPFSLTASEAMPIYLNLQLPDNTWGGTHLIPITATSTTTGEQHTLNFTLEIPLYGELSLQMLEKNANLFAGEQGSYQVKITNDRNTLEELTLSIEGKYAYWYQLPSSSVILGPGEVRELTITVSPPANSPSLNLKDSRLNVTLSSDPFSSFKLNLPLSVTEVQQGTGTDSGGDGDSIPAPSVLAVFATLGVGLRLRRRR